MVGQGRATWALANSVGVTPALWAQRAMSVVLSRAVARLWRGLKGMKLLSHSWPNGRRLIGVTFTLRPLGAPKGRAVAAP